MIELKNNIVLGFAKDESYIIAKSLIDARGYPYKPNKIKFVATEKEFGSALNDFEKNNSSIPIKKLEVVINALELLYYENGDFEALYDGVSKEDVKKLLDELRNLFIQSN
ncbi:MAG: hypothetical protein A3I07_02745 [Candidatus Doudnabacteria bacterium RIFCSPLOWO2_02_FULL_42_9]|uniref:Uncharacterized protein n=1 Tax=Candidatus Doudnabacteria bacterium RIFCSPHIGHO2_01_FULL_41_86 TaxID=1817821 RepID=A0A1F5N9N6_9BACT|nr:MAG: hypothetical protein A2717_02275 [Candidatus Doudnabacteria bacterium RIFCSPHIGHO2_01_FULL_41_86]OGE75588.1 MAG: hypothetical protein A3K07_02030 [Candidatus Doudnabacteria bacterium RIFCSPHIGHO2_01_43_10]OGE85384.1 MAG: hypothetical protein A3E28_01845 [Candidatus Doudnabacteria bacterium RIFCSPHIGHO2_12_FULL_42_22]OGE86922.1 MAG: hypothetical protein A3C49_02680 [Candidatus Doudnabacteria bacterium RIFCSPHIGHO2_02_FULL_42_25]OGE92521.1 MAG: hypothetical protein A2895_02835 [Candidatus